MKRHAKDWNGVRKDKEWSTVDEECLKVDQKLQDSFELIKDFYFAIIGS